MRYFPIPHNIMIKDRVSGNSESFSFVRYANLIWFNDTRWETPKSNLARLIKVIAELEKAPGEMAMLEDQDWGIVKSIIDQPGLVNGAAGPGVPLLLVPTMQIQVGPTFEGAVLEAVTEDPREVVAPSPNGSGARKEERT